MPFNRNVSPKETQESPLTLAERRDSTSNQPKAQSARYIEAEPHPIDVLLLKRSIRPRPKESESRKATVGIGIDNYERNWAPAINSFCIAAIGAGNGRAPSWSEACGSERAPVSTNRTAVGRS